MVCERAEEQLKKNVGGIYESFKKHMHINHLLLQLQLQMTNTDNASAYKFGRSIFLTLFTANWNFLAFSSAERIPSIQFLSLKETSQLTSAGEILIRDNRHEDEDSRVYRQRLRDIIHFVILENRCESNIFCLLGSNNSHP